jgi:phage anti-repressor protein
MEGKKFHSGYEVQQMVQEWLPDNHKNFFLEESIYFVINSNQYHFLFSK